MKRKLMLLLILCMCFLVACGGDDEKESGKNSETQQESEVDTEAEKVANMTEEEYKEYCEVIYRKELFERDDLIGKHVKIYGMLHGKGSYTATSRRTMPCCRQSGSSQGYRNTRRHRSLPPYLRSKRNS